MPSFSGRSAPAASWRTPPHGARGRCDATHLYEAVTSDIELWTPFVIPGGCILFHDYDRHGFPGVVRAVNEFAERHHLSVDDWNGMALIRMPPD